MAKIHPADIPGLVEARLNNKGEATAKQMAQEIGCEVRQVIAALGSLKGLVAGQMKPVGRQKDLELVWKIKKQAAGVGQ